MDSGIHALYWWEHGLLYIGQSVCLRNRKRTHLNQLKNNIHFNYRVQDTYNRLGTPDFIILEVCTTSELDTLEIEYIEYLRPSLNIVNGGSSPSGVNARNSKHSKFTILKIFSLLCRGKTVSSISSRLSISVHSIYGILDGTSHKWLQEKYPDKYEKMLSIPRDAIKNREITKEELDRLIPKYSWVALGKLFGYSDNGIKKRAIALGCTIS